ncbi:MAG TPA: TonB-dependent receptor, partial [Parvularculaceae bacterium]|nr:TonB-dependent receptor [Parvularculaceae bacterium]
MLIFAGDAAAKGSSPRYEFRIEDGTLGPALDKLVRATGAQLLYPHELATTRGIHPVIGRYTVDEALRVMLRGTDLSGGLTKGGVIVVSLDQEKARLAREDGVSGKKLRKSLLASVSALLFGAGGAYAQDQGGGASTDSPKVEETIVVIGTPGESGINRQAASFAVTTINPDQIEKFSPKSTADLFKAIPGVWVESSGGVAGANIDVRGLPGGGDAPFVTLAINGSPIYGTETLSFLEQSSIFRVDETIAGVEGLRGGPNAVFGKGEPGLTVNFNLREGGEDTKGRIKYTTSDFGEQRVDAFLSGKLADDLYFMVGGYVHASHGIRDTQFQSEKGEQFTVNLTKIFDNGKLDIWARQTDDHGQWILPMALNTGNDLGTFAQLGNFTRFRELQIDAAGDMKTFDFSKGRGWNGLVSGLNGNFDLGGGVEVRDNLTYTNGDANTLGFVPSGSPVTAGAVGAITDLPVVTAHGVTLADSDFVQTYGHWVVEKHLKSFINDLSLNKKFEGGHDITFGYYASSFSSDDFWTIGNPIPVHNVANGDALDPASVTPADIEAAGGSAGFMFGLKSAGDARTMAIYGADSWQVTDQFRIDAGVRHEWLTLNYVADTGPGFPDGTNDIVASDLRDNQWAYTGALNYAVTSDFGVFARYSKGYLFPNFDDVRQSQTNVNSVKQLEGGVKYTGDWLRMYGTVYYNKNDSFKSDVGSVTAAEAFKTRAVGAEIDGSVFYGPFSVGFLSTIQNAKITDSTTASDVGNRVLRQPDWQ